MPTLSNNHLSHDQQVADAMAYLALAHPHHFASILAHFPEWTNIQFAGSWFDTEAMGVDSEWPMWLTDAIEDTGVIRWDDGEPWTTDDEEINDGQ
jgi:hypothetical protein